MKKEDKDRIKEVLVKQAAEAPAALGPAGYFRDLVKQSNLPPKWIASRLTWTGVPSTDAVDLINWADNQGTNPEDPRYKALGSLLQPTLENLGLEEQRTIAATIVAHGLYTDPKLLQDLAARYQVPLPAGKDAAATETGPAFAWRGPEDDIQLQSWLKPPPDFFDVGFLKRGIERASGICRIELADGRTGTGFLVAPDLLLTNYHVFKLLPADDLQNNIGQATFRFGALTAAGGDEATGNVVSVASKEPLSSSPVAELDYVLLRLDPAVKTIEGIRVLPFTLAKPAVKSGLNILQHPGGKALMIALSANGVTDVLDDAGLFQYVTSAAGGSSGSPCFDDNWNVVGIHHAERSRAFGAIREGILFGHVHKAVSEFLPK
jgi:Trypsin-like peptidase domain/Effector-associated domain 8